MPGFCWMRREIAQPWPLAMKALSKKKKKKSLWNPSAVLRAASMVTVSIKYL